MKFDEIETALSQKTVGIAGAGGLGSNCAVALIRSGLGKLIVADFDKLDSSNLNRQYYFADQVGQYKVDILKENLLRINPNAEILIHRVKLDQNSIIELFHGVDVLVEAFDLSDQKELLIETALTNWPEKPLVAGLGLAGYGKSNDIKVKQFDNLYICGDHITETNENNPPLGPRVGIVANLQANVVLEILLDRK